MVKICYKHILSYFNKAPRRNSNIRSYPCQKHPERTAPPTSNRWERANTHRWSAR